MFRNKFVQEPGEFLRVHLLAGLVNLIQSLIKFSPVHFAMLRKKYLVMDIKFLGAIPHDERIHTSLKKMTPYMSTYPDSEVSHSIRSIVEKLAYR